MYHALLLALAIESTEQGEPHGFFSRTCTTYASREYCVTTDAFTFSDWGPDVGGGPWFAALFENFAGFSEPWPIRPTAYAFYVPFEVTPLEPFTGLGNWGNPADMPNLAPPWNGYQLFAGTAAERGPAFWDAALEGMAGDLNTWEVWNGPDTPEGMLWAWRAENEDGSIVLDCFQNPAGGDRCVTVTPEPATWALLLTGLLTLGILAKWRGGPEERNRSQGAR